MVTIMVCSDGGDSGDDVLVVVVLVYDMSLPKLKPASVVLA